MKVQCTFECDGRERVAVFSIPEKPEAGEQRLVVREYASGAAMAKKLAGWAHAHGADL